MQPPLRPDQQVELATRHAGEGEPDCGPAPAAQSHYPPTNRRCRRTISCASAPAAVRTGCAFDAGWSCDTVRRAAWQMMDCSRPAAEQSLPARGHTLRQMGQRARRRLQRRQMLAWPQGISATCTGRTCARPQQLPLRGYIQPTGRVQDQHPSRPALASRERGRGTRGLRCELWAALVS